MTSVAGILTDIHHVPARHDPLAEALHFLRMDGMFYCPSELTSPWGLTLPPMPDCLWFHVVTKGECTLLEASGQRVEMQAGDIAVLPHGAGHQVFDADESPVPLVFDLPHEYVSRQYAILRHGGGGERTDAICGVVHLGHPVARNLLTMLPQIIHIDAASRPADWHWLPTMLSLMATETSSAQPGGETVVTRLCDVLVIQAIRSWIESDPDAQTGWLGALRDPAIGRAIALIHDDPARDWTVVSLAREAAMSRSGFSAKFTELVGTSPKQYVTRWRMQVAEDLLARETTSIAGIAAQLGYSSEAAFSRAFKRETGDAPSHARRRADLVDLAQDLAGPAS